MFQSTHVVLGGNGAVKVGVQEGDLLEDVAADTGNLAKEEDGSSAGEHTEATSEGTTGWESGYATMKPRLSLRF